MTSNDTLAARAADLAGQHEPRTPGRRAAAALHVALVTTRTPDAARRALATVRDPATRAAAITILDQLAEPADAARTTACNPPAKSKEQPG